MRRGATIWILSAWRRAEVVPGGSVRLAAARINRKAVSSADIILMGEEYQIKLFSVRYITAKRISVTAPWPQVTL